MDMSARLLSRLRPRIHRPRTPAEALVLALLAATAVGGVAAVWWTGRPCLAIHGLARGVGDTMVFGADGRPWFALDEQRRDVPLAQVSPYLRKAVVAVEDRRFYLHPGIDPVGVARAAWTSLRHGASLQGG